MTYVLLQVRSYTIFVVLNTSERGYLCEGGSNGLQPMLACPLHIGSKFQDVHWCLPRAICSGG